MATFGNLNAATVHARNDNVIDSYTMSCTSSTYRYNDIVMNDIVALPAPGQRSAPDGRVRFTGRGGAGGGVV